MSFPVYFYLGSFRVHPHLVFETLAYAVAFRLYLWLRKRKGDVVDDANRWWVIAAAAMGAAAGSKILYWFEDPRLSLQHFADPAFLFSGKTIVGALIGGLAAVECMKKRLNITRRTGDLFALPLCCGIVIGRIGCFLTGTEDHTAGVATMLPWGVNFGDGVLRHPTQLYEIAFALALAAFLWRKMQQPHLEGDIFKKFMVFYFAFRFSCDFLKPNVRILAHLSSIQWACAGMVVYYSADIARWFHADVRYSQENGFEKSAKLVEK